MKAVHLCASLLVIVLISVQTLIGQAPALGQPIASRSPKHLSQRSRRGNTWFANRGGYPPEHPRSDPNASAPPPPGFLAATQIAAGGATIYRAIGGDVNGDKLPDVITLVQSSVSSTGTYLAVLLGSANPGTATPILTPVTFATGDLIIVADVNKDGKDDVILVHGGNGKKAKSSANVSPPANSSSMDVLLSNGNGTFTAPQNFPTGISFPVAAAFWDVNRDQKLDVVVVDGQSNQAAFLLGNGQDGFAAPQMTVFPGQASLGVLADVDLDGNLDLVTNNTLYPGDGQGGFLTGVPFQINDGQNDGALSSESVAVADITGDGRLDVVTANGYWNTFSVFVNQGGRRLVQSGASLWSGNDPVALALADVNGDGKADIVVTNAAESDLSVFLGKGDGTFNSPAAGYAIGGSPSTRAVLADFNGDGNIDVVLSDNQSSVVLALGSGDGTFLAAQDANIVVPPGSSNAGGAISIASADFNGDGVPDFVVGQSSTSPGLGLVVFLANSGGSLAKGVAYAQNDALSYVAVGDLNRDGKADIVASNWATGAVEVLLGNGDGTFQSPMSISLPGIPNGLVVADLNGDGWPDVALAGKDPVVYILLNDGKGALTLAGTYPISGAGYELVAADVNNDGKLDLCVAMTSNTRVAILLGNGNGTFTAAPDYDTTLPSPYGIAAGDLKKNGSLDLVVTSPSSGSLAVAIANGGGSFGSPSIYQTTVLSSQWSPFSEEVALSDVNGDGNLDIVYADSGYSSVGVLVGDGAGNFYGPTQFPTGGGSWAVAIADLNKDGWPDVVTADGRFSGVSVLYNTGAPRSTPDFTVAANPSSVQVTSGGTAATTISLSSRNSFIGSVQLTCQNLPKALSCVFTPSVVHLASGKTTSSQLTIAAAQSNSLAFGFGQGFTALAILPLLGGVFLWRVPRAIGRASALAIFASLMLLSGCGGLAATKNTGQTYTITVKATAWNGTSHSLPLQVTVPQ
jgi:FG-GAP-like repeat/FG-GAP repeat